MKSEPSRPEAHVLAAMIENAKARIADGAEDAAGGRVILGRFEDDEGRGFALAFLPLHLARPLLDAISGGRRIAAIEEYIEVEPPQ